MAMATLATVQCSATVTAHSCGNCSADTQKSCAATRGVYVLIWAQRLDRSAGQAGRRQAGGRQAGNSFGQFLRQSRFVCLSVHLSVSQLASSVTVLRSLSQAKLKPRLPLALPRSLTVSLYKFCGCQAPILPLQRALLFSDTLSAFSELFSI